MKIARISLSLTFIFLSVTGFAQEVFDTVFVYPPFNELSRRRPALDSLSFTETKYGSNILIIYSKRSSGPASMNSKSEYYNLDFEGDRYLLQKKWGTVLLPEKEIALLIKRTCDAYYKLDGHWRKDSLFIRHSYWCDSNDSDSERVFIAIPHRIEFKQGKEKLREQLEEVVTPYKRMLDITTVYIFRLLVSRDSSISSVKMVEGDSASLAAGVLMDELKRSGPWIPAQQGGRSVKAYMKVYVRLEPKSKLVVEYGE